jgi:hypothetical protein
MTVPAVSVSPGYHLDIKKSDAILLNGTTVPYNKMQMIQINQKRTGSSMTSVNTLD